MLVSDKGIKDLISKGFIQNGDEGRVGPVSYDLGTKEFYLDGKERRPKVTLRPGDSAFVGSEEIVTIPADMAARVLLRNSRIREGLSLDAPLYYPGHKTRIYFRITNVSASVIALSSGSGIASLAFEKLESAPEEAYNGAFTDEFDFTGMASYQDVYSSEIEVLDK